MLAPGMIRYFQSWLAGKKAQTTSEKKRINVPFVPPGTALPFPDYFPGWPTLHTANMSSESLDEDASLDTLKDSSYSEKAFFPSHRALQKQQVLLRTKRDFCTHFWLPTYTHRLG